MKKLSILLSILMIATVSVFAQAPQKFSYQAVLRDAGNNLVTNHAVGVRISILQGGIDGAVVYVETQSVATNANGLMTLEIGDGKTQQGVFDEIDWAQGPYFLKTETDPKGGVDYSVTSTQQLLSVPYALYAKEAGNSFSGDYNDLKNKPAIPKNVGELANDAGYITLNDLPEAPKGGNLPKEAAVVQTEDCGEINLCELVNQLEQLAQRQEQMEEFRNVLQPTVITNSVGYITDHTADGGGKVTAEGYDAVTARGVCWGTEPNPTTAGSHTSNGAGTGGFISMLTDLTPNTTYYVRAYATNSVGTAYGENVMFTTLADWEDTCAIITLPYSENFDTYTSSTVSATGVQPDCWKLITMEAELDESTMPQVFRGYATSGSYSLRMKNRCVYAMPELRNDVAISELTMTFSLRQPKSVYRLQVGVVNETGEFTLVKTVKNSGTGIEPVTVSFSNYTGDGHRIAFRNSLVKGADLEYSYNYIDDIVITLPEGVVVDEKSCPGAAMVNDHEGNVYATVQIGNQCWMRDNLRTTTSPTTGTYLIPAAGSSYTYTGKQARWYNDDSTTYAPMNYGLLYNWNAAMDTFNTVYGETSVNTSTSNAVLASFNGNRRGICPAGWHLPSDAEWTQLTDYVSSQSEYTCGYNSRYIAKALASTTGWNSYTNTCAVGNNPSTNNATGFSALPAGVYFVTCSYGYCHFGDYADFWSATESNGYGAYYRYLTYLNAGVYRGDNHKDDGLSVRCIRDETSGGGETSATVPTVTTANVSDITASSATCGGNVTADGGATVTACGVCWSTSNNPTVEGSHTSDGFGTGEFTSILADLQANTTYYVRAYATNSVGTAYGEEVSFTTATSSGTDGQPCPGAATVTDIDGNTYNTVQIGNQCWMRENLRTTHYANGDSISLGTETSEITPYRYNPNNDAGNVATYGYLYNWPALMHGATSSSFNPSGVQGICPTGWHVPSDAEWTQLTDYVKSQSEYTCGDNSSYIAKALASTIGWITYSSTCAVGNDPGMNNATGFSALSAGVYYYGNYGYFGNIADFWSATEGDGGNAYYRNLYYNDAYVYRYNYDKSYGFSVRCLRDETSGGGETSATLPTVTTAEVSDITATTATCGGNVTADDGTTVTARGVCWSTSPNPTVESSYTSDGSGTGSFTSNITGLTAGTTYYVRAYATNSWGTVYGEEVSFTTLQEVVNNDGLPCPGAAMVTDIDNNTYNTVQIGNQCWMRENLRTTHYANGDSIALGTETSEITPYRYNPNNNANNVPTYGYLYNWPAVMHGATSSSFNPSGVQGICPTGWHVPSDAEWTQLTDYVGSQPQYQCNLSISSGNIAKALASTIEWSSSRNSSCDVGYNTSTNNATGFSALPAGFYNDVYLNLGQGAYFQSATECGDYNVAVYKLLFNNYSFGGIAYGKGSGYSVRCVRDETSGGGETSATLPTVTTAEVSDITATTATCGGNVTADDGTTVTARGVCWSTSSNPTVEDNYTTNGNIAGTFTSNLTSLLPNTIYYVRAYVMSDLDTVYGNEVEFATLIGPPTVTTAEVNNITATTATCGGNVIADGGANVTVRGVCWSTSNYPTLDDNYTTDGSGTGEFTSTLIGFIPGAVYYVRAYATNSEGTSYGNVQRFAILNPNDGSSCPGAATVTDIDGNTYNTVQIGNQCWMRENLRTTHYADGTAIPMGSTYSNTDPYRFAPDSNDFNVSTYGYLYNWPALMHGATSSSFNPSGVQGICPTGWHVPSDAEWTQLTDYVKSQSEYVCGENTYNIAKSLASTTGWNSSSTTCAVGNNSGTNNTTGFSVLPAGLYNFGRYFGFGDEAACWSATEHNGINAYYRCVISSASNQVTYGCSSKYLSVSVRCLRNETSSVPTVFTANVSNITATTATCGGNVTSDGGATVTVRGVCWSTSQNPTVEGSHTNDGAGTGEFASVLSDLQANTIYYVRAYATNSEGTRYGEEVSFFATTFTSLGQDGQPCPGAATVTDVDGNTYNTVQIGNQCWMRENLRTTHYSPFGDIPLGTSTSSITPYRYNPNNDANNVPTYGYLYNWPAVMYGAPSSSSNPSGVQGICPDGWHVPSDAEWTQLTNYVGSQPQYQCDGSSTNIAKALASTIGWISSSTNTCAIGNNPSTNNATGFSALPAGYYDGGNSSKQFGSVADYWSATEQSNNTAYDRYFSGSVVYGSSYSYSKSDAFSVRCVRD